MNLSTLDRVLWLLGFFGHLALLWVLTFRARWRVFPVFTGLIAYQVAQTLVLFFAFRNGTRHTYFLAYWLLAAGDYSFQVALIFEIARLVLRPTGTWIRDARAGFLMGSTASVLIAAALSMGISPPGVRGLDLWEMRVTLFTSLLTCELFLSISLAANYLGLPWRSHVMSLGQGLAAWSAVAVIGDVAHVATGWHRELIIFDELRMYIYLAVLAFWIVAFWRPERKRAPIAKELQDYIAVLHQRLS